MPPFKPSPAEVLVGVDGACWGDGSRQ